MHPISILSTLSVLGLAVAAPLETRETGAVAETWVYTCYGTAGCKRSIIADPSSAESVVSAVAETLKKRETGAVAETWVYTCYGTAGCKRSVIVDPSSAENVVAAVAETLK